MKFLRASWFPLLLGLIILVVILNQVLFTSAAVHDDFPIPNNLVATDEWQPPDMNALPNDEQGNQVRYGRQLIVNTSLFFGPKGKISAITNGVFACYLRAQRHFSSLTWTAGGRATRFGSA